MSEKIFSISEAATYLSVNPQTLRRWDKRNIISPIKVGTRGDRKYKISDLQKLLKNRPFQREDSQQKGTTGENILQELLSEALQEWGFELTELRPQGGGIQFGKDKIVSWVGKVDEEEISFAWSFEAKHYGKADKKREIPKEKIQSKLTQVHNSSVPKDCWCVFSPFSYVDNETRDLVDQAFVKKSYPFRIVLWTQYEQIEELIKCFPSIYKKIYKKDASLTQEEREKTLSGWKKRIINATLEGKLLQSKTLISSKQKEALSSSIAKEMKKQLQQEGIDVSLTTPLKSEKMSQLKLETISVNEEIDKALGLLDLGKSQEALTKFFLLLGRIEDKDGFRHEKARLYNNIGVAYNLQRQTDRAIEYFQKAVNTEENFTVGLTNLSAAYITKGEEAKGEIEKQKFIKNAEMILQPLWEEFSDKSATSVLQVQMRLLRTKEGIPGLITFIKNQSNNLPAKHFSSNATLAFMVASTYLEAHEPELALDYAKKAYDLDKDDPETLFLRGRSYMSIAIKENAPISATYWTDILPVFSKKENLKKALKDIDETIDDAASKGMEFILPQAYFLQSMGNIWAGEEIKPLPSIEMEGMEDQKHFLEFVLSFRKRDYEHSYAILKSLYEYGNIPYEEKFRIARAYLYHGQPEIAKELFDSIKDEATKRENVLYWMDYSVVATLLGEKNSAILSAAKAREVATGERRRDALSHYGAVMLRFADDKEGNRLLESAQAFEKEFPDEKILTPYDIDTVFSMMKERQEWVKNIKKIYKENPIPSYFLQETFKQPYVMVWAGRDPEMPLEYTIVSNEFNQELEDNYSKGKIFVFDYLSLLTLSKLNLLSELEKLLPKMQVTFSLFQKVQEELLKKEDETLRRLWNFLRKSKIIEIVSKIKKKKLQGGRVNDIFEEWIVDSIMLGKQKGAVMVSDDLRFLRFLKSENVLSINSWLILQKAKEKQLLDPLMYSRSIGKLAECFYVFLGFNGDDLFDITFEDDFKLTARTYHLINQIFLPGSSLKSFAEVFVKFIINLWRPGMLMDDRLFWMDYFMDIFAKLIEQAAAGTVNGDEVLGIAPTLGMMWRYAVANASKDDLLSLQAKFPDMMKSPLLKKSKEKIGQMIKTRIIELDTTEKDKTS